jgi:hypothetical protein
MKKQAGPRRGTNKRAIWEWLVVHRKPALAEEIGAALYSHSSCAGYMGLVDGPHPDKTRWARRLLKALFEDGHVRRTPNEPARWTAIKD